MSKNELIITGHWWLPTNPTSILPGTLTFDYQKGGSLVISTQFHLPIEFHLTRFKENFIILGKSTKGKRITLIAYSTIRISEGHEVSISFNIKFILIGYHFNNHKEVLFDNIIAQYSNLSKYLNIFDFESYEDNTNNKSFNLKPIDVVIEKICSIQILYKSILTEELSNSSINENIYIKFRKFEKGTLEDYIELVGIFMDFLNFFLPDDIIHLSFIGFISLNDKSAFNNIEILWASPIQNKTDKSITGRKYLFYIIKGKLNEYLNLWFNFKNQFDVVYSHYFSVMYNPDLYLSNKFLTITGAVETFHKKKFGKRSTIYKDKRNFVKRIKPLVVKTIKENPETIDDLPKIKELIGYWSQPTLTERIRELIHDHWEIMSINSIKIGNIECFAKKISQYRNDHAHGNNLIEIEDYYDLYFTYKDLHMLLFLCILSQLGFSNKSIKEVLHFDELKVIRKSHNNMTFELLEPNILIVLAWLKENEIFCKLPKRLIEDLESLLKIIQNVQRCLDNDFSSFTQSSTEKDSDKSSFLSQYDRIKKDKLLNEINTINREHIKKYWKNISNHDVSYISLALWCGCMSSLQLLTTGRKQEWELFFSTIEKLSSVNPIYGIGVELALVWKLKNNSDAIFFENIPTHWHIRKYEKLFYNHNNVNIQ